MCQMIEQLKKFILMSLVTIPADYYEQLIIIIELQQLPFTYITSDIVVR